MRSFSGLWFYVLSGIALALVGLSLWYSNTLVRSLAEREQRLVRFWADAAEYIYNHQDEQSLFLITQVLLHTPGELPLVSVPAIATDSSGTQPLTHNLSFGGRFSPKDSVAKVRRELEDMRSDPNFLPIRVNLPDSTFQLVYYRETNELRQLRWFPYITLGVLAFFVLIVGFNLLMAARSRMNSLWVGMARETAHQLGTPISGLMAWMELLRDGDGPARPDVLRELAADVDKLNLIAERFSKIGSEPETRPTDLGPLLESVAAYIRQRSSSKVSIEVEDLLPPGTRVPVSPLLFEWVMENLLKNALDAGAKRIRMFVFRKGRHVLLDVEDNGQGMTKRQARAAFRPGFTTKKRGWGLGLSLAQRVIQQYHRGRIHIRYTEPGRGTTFRITLPAAP